jgi:RNA polymerase sigma-70 factor (ECF subfamily)
MENRQFLTTRWSLVEAAGGSEGERARARAGRAVRRVLVSALRFVRRSGVGAEEAQGRRAGLLRGLIERGDLAKLTRGAGRFRGFLKVAVRNHLANVRDRERTEKRGGGRVRLAVDWRARPSDFAREPGARRNPSAPSTGCGRWNCSSAASASSRPSTTRRAGANVFAALKGALQGGEDSLDTRPGRRAAPDSEGAVRVAVHRLRKRFGERLRARIADTVASPEEVEPELDELRRALGS